MEKQSEMCETKSFVNKYFGNLDLINGVKWSEKYSDTFEKVWNKLPNVVGSTVATFAIFTLGSIFRGEWILILVHFLKQISRAEDSSENTQENITTQNSSNLSVEPFRLHNALTFMTASVGVSLLIYYTVGGFLHWYFYIHQRHLAHEWKIQPDKFMTPELERHAIALGSFSMLLVSALGGLLACYIANGGPSKIYYKYDEFGWLWFFLQFPFHFLYIDYAIYWLHRIYHTRWLYKTFHKVHHYYKQPTVFTTTAIHPLEILHVQLTMIFPIFVVPTHWIPFYTVAIYNYYHGIIDHSGIDFKAYWWQPWQPDAVFHDNHHQYFHVNYALNCKLWDKIHGTSRRNDRIYTIDTVSGAGKKISEATEAEIMLDIEERKSENPKAYRSDDFVKSLAAMSALKKTK